MGDQKFTFSIGGKHPAKIQAVRKLSWADVRKIFEKDPPVSDDKSSAGWYCPAEFRKNYRDGDNFVARYALTWDFDHIDEFDLDDLKSNLTEAQHDWLMYTTFSHSPDKPRVRVIIPLSRPVDGNEFQCISRTYVDKMVGIEKAAKESHVIAQFMFKPVRKEGTPSSNYWAIYGLNEGVLDVDAILGSYDDWTDMSKWPTRLKGDAAHNVDGITSPLEKPGVVGDFCRSFRITDAIRRFDLPYVPTEVEDRWTYTKGSRPEGVVIYDDDTKVHIHHDTDPASGQQNAFDLVRLHKFHGMDTEEELAKPITLRESFKAMAGFASALPELQALQVANDFEDLGPPSEEEEAANAEVAAKAVEKHEALVERFKVYDPEEYDKRKRPQWIIRNTIPQAELVVVFGDSGSGKSFFVLDMCASIQRGVEWRGLRVQKGRVVYVCAEGAGGFQLRQRAYSSQFGIPLRDMPAVIPEGPNLLEKDDAVALCASIKRYGEVAVIVIDTLSAVTPGGNENSGEDVGAVISRCKAISHQTGAVVVLVHHSGKDAAKGARGWSGLRAAADAEIEISRNGDFRTATITKQKDGSDGQEYFFKLGVIVVDQDEFDGSDITSCYIEVVQDAPKSSKKEPTSAVQKMVWEKAKDLGASSGRIERKNLVGATVAMLPEPGEGERDRRGDMIRQAIDRLCMAEFLHVHDKIWLSCTAQEVIEAVGDFE
jgi:hypothetical protein